MLKIIAYICICITHEAEGTDTFLSKTVKPLAMGSCTEPIPDSYLCRDLSYVLCSQALLGTITVNSAACR